MNAIGLSFLSAAGAGLMVFALQRLGLRELRAWGEPVPSALCGRSAWWMTAGAALGFVLHIAQAPSFVTATWQDAGGALLLGLFSALLIVLIRIDAHTRLLPDTLTILLAVSGVAFHAITGKIPLTESLIGGIAGYAGLMIFSALYGRIRGKPAMGRGDFAMFGALGIWLGWSSLAPVLFMASLFALAIAVCTHRRFLATEDNRARDGIGHKGASLLASQIAFGPALALAGIAGWIALV